MIWVNRVSITLFKFIGLGIIPFMPIMPFIGQRKHWQDPAKLSLPSRLPDIRYRSLALFNGWNPYH
eukprot:scaffold33982_cov70-Attheya_sp.AAC.2